MWLIQVKKYWKIALILLVSVLVLLYFVFFKKEDEVDLEETESKLKKGLNEIKDQLTEVQHKAEIETVIARTKSEEVTKELNDIAKEKDNKKRRQRLAELAKRD